MFYITVNYNVLFSFMQQAVYCRQALVSSACGVHGGQVAARLTTLLLRQDGVSDNCLTTLQHDNYRLHYSGTLTNCEQISLEDSFNC